MKRRVSTMLAVAVTAGVLSFGFARPASADHSSKSKEKMYRLGTYAAAGVTAYGLLKGNTTMTILGAAGTYLAHKGWKNQVEKRHEDDRWGDRRGDWRRRDDDWRRRDDDWRRRDRYDPRRSRR